MGVARGVGQSEIVGRIHVAPIKIRTQFYPCSFTVLDSPNLEFIFGRGHDACWLFTIKKETLKKLRKRCVREFDVDGKTTVFSGHAKECHLIISSAIQTEPKYHISWIV